VLSTAMVGLGYFWAVDGVADGKGAKNRNLVSPSPEPLRYVLD
jgi:hypothetical protein